MDYTTLTYMAHVEGFQDQSALRIKHANEADDGQDDPQRQTAALAAGGDTVTISEEGQRLSGQSVQKAEESGESDTEQTLTEQRIERLEKRIEEIQKEIQEVSEGNLPKKEKQEKIQVLTSELMQAQQELSELQSNSGAASTGGTPAEGFANSLT